MPKTKKEKLKKAKAPVMMQFRTVDRMVSFPSKMVAEIKAMNLPPLIESYCFRFILVLRTLNRKKRRNHFLYVSLSKVYIEKMFKSKYIEVLRILKTNNIIECDERFWYGEKSWKVKRYKINDRFAVEDEFVTVSYKERMPYEEFVRQRNIRKDFVEDIESLKLDIKELQEISKKRVDDIKIESFPRNEEIKDERLKVRIKTFNYENPSYITTLPKALATAKKHNLSLIQDGNECYITEEKLFIHMKKEYVKSSDHQAIQRLSKKYWYAERNTTNSRLDTNITNLCGKMMDHIIDQNNLVELDLSNSQFAILCHILKDKNIGPDFELFKQLSVSGGLYEFIQEKLGLESRKKAKQLTFELLFSSHLNRNPYITKLKEFFPNVILWINEYKKKNGYNQFSILLQQKEAEMFVDHIHSHLKAELGFCLTKHDCVLVRKEDETKAREFIQMYFDSIGFEGRLK